MKPEPLISEDGQQLTAAGEALFAECQRANPDQALLIPVLVGGDWWARTEDEARSERCVLPAYLRRSPTDGSIAFWNGFVQPLFTRAIAERIVELQQELIVETGDEYVESLRIDADDDAIVVGVEGQYRKETPKGEREWRIKPVVFGRTPLYAIGNAYWTWQAVGDTLGRDPFHAWLRERQEAGERLGSPAGNPDLLARFTIETEKC